MKLEVGMYIRSPKGKIEKIYSLVEQDNPIFPYTINYTARFRIDIKKASHNLIDLIEVGDIVEWKFKFDEDNITYKSEVEESFEKEICFLGDRFELKNIVIVRVLTHEQFEREAYKVE